MIVKARSRLKRKAVTDRFVYSVHTINAIKRDFARTIKKGKKGQIVSSYFLLLKHREKKDVDFPSAL